VISPRSVLLATCVIARDPRVDAGALLDLWAREVAVPVNPLDRSGANASAAVVDDLDNQAFLLAAIRGTRAGLAVGCHLGTRVNGRSDDEPFVVSTRSVDAARQLALAAADGQVLLSGDLGAFMTIARARLAPNLESTRVRVAGGPDAAAYRVRVASVPPPTVRGGNTTPGTLDEGRRSRLFERLGAALTPFLGPIAPLMLQQLPSGRITAQELIDAIVRNLPTSQRDPVKRLIEDEIRTLR
jgi:hypothetical protein